METDLQRLKEVFTRRNIPYSTHGTSDIVILEIPKNTHLMYHKFRFTKDGRLMNAT